jgi:hypothetical protein
VTVIIVLEMNIVQILNSSSIWSVLKGSDNGILQLLLVDFWTLSIVWHSERIAVF